MFNTKIKNQLQSQAAELSELRQLRDGLNREMLTLSIDSTFKITACVGADAELIQLPRCH